MVLKINFKATDIELTEELRRYVSDKLAAVNKLALNQNPSAELLAQVELGRTTVHHKHGEIYRAEINFHWAGRRFRAETAAADLYTAFDETKDELLREIKTWRKKQGTLVRRGARALKNLLRGIYDWRRRR